VQARLCKISETLKDNTITKLLRVLDQQITISGLRCEIRAQAISYVVDATAHLWRGDHIDQRTRGVRYRHFDRTAPQRFQSEEPFRLHVAQHENRTLGDHAFFCNTPCSEDEGLIEKLLGKFPMMGGRPAADVAFIEERWCEDPGVCDHLFAASQVQRHRNIKPMSYPPEPTLLFPPR
jgi:hypothetical protein